MEAHGTRLSYFVEGMDCANCVARVEKMVGGLPGTGEVKTSFTRQTLTLELDETQTSRAALENRRRPSSPPSSGLMRAWSVTS